MTARLDKDRPSGTEPAQRVVEPRGDADEFGWHCAIEVGSAKLGRALEAAVLVEDDARVRRAPPTAGNPQAMLDLRYSARFNMRFTYTLR